jgi:hypothetical protein
MSVARGLLDWDDYGKLTTSDRLHSIGKTDEERDPLQSNGEYPDILSLTSRLEGEPDLTRAKRTA